MAQVAEGNKNTKGGSSQETLVNLHQVQHPSQTRETDKPAPNGGR